MRNRFARVVTITVLSRMAAGSLVIVEANGRRRRLGHGSPEATMVLHSDDAWAAFLGGSLSLADAYAEGLWSSPDLVALIRLAARNMPAIDRVRTRLLPLSRPSALIRARRRPNDRDQRRRDIASHYDLGNELFSRMLDPSMTYSCALFGDRHMSLERAQEAKLEMVCRKLDLGPNDRVLEIGSGWGSFSIYAARTRGCRVTTTTISREQHDYVVAQVAAAGLSDHVTVLSQDFRDLGGRYDKLVSIEMIEAVGWQNIGHFFEQCSQLLAADGAMLLQAITIDDRAYEVEKASRSFIKEYIFPGGTLPSIAVITDRLARRTDLQTQAVEDITVHYVETLRQWREAFIAHSEELERLGYDARFRRIWMLYLAYCEAGFAERRICDIQMLLTKPRYRSTSRVAGDAVRLEQEHAA